MTNNSDHFILQIEHDPTTHQTIRLNLTTGHLYFEEPSTPGFSSYYTPLGPLHSYILLPDISNPDSTVPCSYLITDVTIELRSPPQSIEPDGEPRYYINTHLQKEEPTNA